MRIRNGSMLVAGAVLIAGQPALATITTIDFTGGPGATYQYPYGAGEIEIYSLYSLTDTSTGGAVPAMTVSVGDTIQGTVSFAATVTSPGSRVLYSDTLAILDAVPYATVKAFSFNASIQFYRGTTNVTPSDIPSYGGSGGYLALGGFAYGSVVPSFVFDSIQYSLTLTDILDGSGRPIQSVGLQSSSSSFSTVAVIDTAVPEPASWAMMLGGLGLVGGAMRRRNWYTVARGAVPIGE